MAHPLRAANAMAFASVVSSATLVLFTLVVAIWLSSRFVLPQLLSLVVRAPPSARRRRPNHISSGRGVPSKSRAVPHPVPTRVYLQPNHHPPISNRAQPPITPTRSA